MLQVGNAVPPPMARAIGMEIKKCLLTKEFEDKKQKEEQEKQKQKEAQKQTKVVGSQKDNKDTEESAEKDVDLNEEEYTQ